MNFKRELSLMEIRETFPGLLKIKSEVEGLGAEISIRVLVDQEIARADMSRSEEGSCSNCKTKVVQIAWTGQLNGTPMEFSGLACPKCKHILEYAGATTAPFDLSKMLGL